MYCKSLQPLYYHNEHRNYGAPQWRYLLGYHGSYCSESKWYWVDTNPYSTESNAYSTESAVGLVLNLCALGYTVCSYYTCTTITSREILARQPCGFAHNFSH